MKFSNIIIFILLYSTTNISIESNPLDNIINFLLQIRSNKTVFNNDNIYDSNDSITFNTTFIETQSLLKNNSYLKRNNEYYIHHPCYLKNYINNTKKIIGTGDFQKCYNIQKSSTINCKDCNQQRNDESILLGQEFSLLGLIYQIQSIPIKDFIKRTMETCNMDYKSFIDKYVSKNEIIVKKYSESEYNSVCFKSIYLIIILEKIIINPSLNLIFSDSVDSEIENKFLLNDNIKIEFPITPLYMRILFFSYFSFCVFVYVFKANIVNTLIKKNVEFKNNTDDYEKKRNSMIYSLIVKYYLLKNKTQLVQTYVDNNIFTDDKTYRNFFKNILNDPSNYDVLNSFEKVENKSNYYKSMIITTLFLISLLIGLLLLMNYMFILLLGLVTNFFYFLLGIVLIVTFLEFLKLIYYYENVRYLNNKLLTSRDLLFISQETVDV